MDVHLSPNSSSCKYSICTAFWMSIIDKLKKKSQNKISSPNLSKGTDGTTFSSAFHYHLYCLQVVSHFNLIIKCTGVVHLKIQSLLTGLYSTSLTSYCVFIWPQFDDCNKAKHSTVLTIYLHTLLSVSPLLPNTVSSFVIIDSPLENPVWSVQYTQLFCVSFIEV